MDVKERAAVGSGPDQSTRAQSTTIKPGKLNNMLRHFARGARLHRFSAERIGDHCLPTSVSDLQITHSITFSRERVKVPNRFGSETSVCEYWLEGDQLLRARQIVGVKEAV